jgi:tetratricopeptide (TPR) repeat protein/acyl carrier protein
LAYRVNETSPTPDRPAIDEPTRGHSIRIVDESGRLLPKFTVGKIEVCGPTITSGYFNDDVANNTLFTADGWIRTGDLGRLDGRILTVMGREKEVIIVNATKFSLLEIEEALTQINDVSEIYATVVREKRAGKERLAVAYCSPCPSPELEVDIRRSVFVRFGFGLLHCRAISSSDFPRTASGKIQRHKLGDMIKSERPEGASEPVEGTDAVMTRVRRMMAHHLDGVIPPPEGNFFHFGADSLDALLFTTEIERVFGVVFPPVTLSSVSTAQAISEYIESSSRKDSEPVTVVPVRSGDQNVRVFLMPGVYGHNGYASVLGSAFRGGEEIWTLHTSNTDDSTKSFESLRELAITYAEAIKSIQRRGPFHVAGHSFGALVAFEVAGYLASQGEKVETLAIIDNMAPVHLQGIGLTAGSPPDTVAGYNLYLAEKNTPDPIDVSILYLRAKDSPYLCLSDRSAGWDFLTTKGVVSIDLPGDHHSIVRGSNCERLAECISSHIDKKRQGIFLPPLSVPHKVRDHINRAACHRTEGDIEAAIAHLKSAIALRPRLPYWVYSELAFLLFAAGRSSEAEKYYSKTLRRDPWPIGTKCRFLPFLTQAKMFAHVNAVYSDAQTLTVDSVASARTKADILVTCQAWEFARRSLLKGLEIAPESIELRIRLVSVLLSLQKSTEAVIHIEKALEFEPVNDAALIALGSIGHRLGQTNLAERCIFRSLQVDANGEPEAFEILRSIATSRGDTELADAYKQKRDSLRAKRSLRRL